jgi:hypothetical protein
VPKFRRCAGWFEGTNFQCQWEIEGEVVTGRP